MLAARGVLKLVDEQMADVAGDAGDAFSVVVENIECGEGELGEVDLVLFGEDNFEVGDSLAQNREDVAERGPLGFGVPGWRQAADGAECGKELGRVLEPVQENLHGVFALPRLAAGCGEALAHIH